MPKTKTEEASLPRLPRLARHKRDQATGIEALLALEQSTKNEDFNLPHDPFKQKQPHNKRLKPSKHKNAMKRHSSASFSSPKPFQSSQPSLLPVNTSTKTDTTSFINTSKSHDDGKWKASTTPPTPISSPVPESFKSYPIASSRALSQDTFSEITSGSSSSVSHDKRSHSATADLASSSVLKGFELELAQDVISKLILHDQASLLNVPFDHQTFSHHVLHASYPASLFNIRENLESGKYTTLDAIDQDVCLVFKLCFIHYVPGIFVSEAGKQLTECYRKLYEYYDSISTKMKYHIAVGSKSSSSGTSTGASSNRPLPFSHEPTASTFLTDIDQTTLSATYSPIVPLSDPNLMNHGPSSPIPETPNTSPPSASPLQHPIASASHSTAALSQANDIPAILHPTLRAKMKSLIHEMINRKESVGLRLPVDSAAHGGPNYTKAITHTTDFETLLANLQQGQYKTVEEFVNDTRLIFTNCYAINPEGYFLSRNAKILEKMLDTEAPKLKRDEHKLKRAAYGSHRSSQFISRESDQVSSSSDDSESISPMDTELGKYKYVLDRIRLHPSYSVFGAPVDDELFGVPVYYEIVKQPMDFGTIRDLYILGGYDNADQLLHDVKLVFFNCYLFNLPGEEVRQMGCDLQAEFNRLCTFRGLRTISVDDTVREVAEAVHASHSPFIK